MRRPGGSESDTQRARLLALAVANLVLLASLVAGVLAMRARLGVEEPLLALDARNATAIVLEQTGGGTGTTIRMERAGGWELVVNGARYPAREDRIEPFLDELSAARIVRTVTHDSPEIVDAAPEGGGRLLRLVTAGGEAELLFFDTDEPGGLLSVRRGEAVVLARAAVGFYLRQPASFWAYLRLLPESAVPADVIRLEVEETVLRRELVAGEERWIAVSGSDTVPVAEDAAFDLARAVVDLVGNGFYGGEWLPDLEPVLLVRVELADGRRFSVEIRRDGELMVARPSGPALPGAAYGGLLYTIAPESVRRLVPGPELER